VAGARRWAAFLRGISPMNAKMPDLKRAFEAAGFEDVSTVISSGNVVFTARSSSAAAVQRKAESAMSRELGRSFLTIARRIDTLREMLEEDPYARFRLRAGSKRVVTFLREPSRAQLKLPMERDGARILVATETEVFSAYVPQPDAGGGFMKVIEDAYGQEVTTRTWDTVRKVVARGSS
jgi:uncharacterized protein (DUF1697 family)